MQDTGTQWILNWVPIFVVLYTTGDCYYFLELFETSMRIKCIYVAAVAVNIGTIYLALVGTILTARFTLTQLYVVEQQVQADLDLCLEHSNATTATVAAVTASQQSTYATFVDNTVRTSNGMNRLQQSGSEEAAITTLRWLESYRSIRHDLHIVSETFGPRMLLGLFLFLVDVTSMVLVGFEQLIKDITSASSHKVAPFFLQMYIPNAAMLVVTLFNMAYTQTECIQYIGPKLSMLVVRRPNRWQYSSLACMFLLAALRIHVGNFEVTPEYSNALTLWFLALLLYVFGLKAPGVG